ncbi:sodium channel and clathrin linker 1 isoform X2 [Trichomycterus rosablanca]|uniref:sodium channel and clathrin linker 1 isoform X2 n=1 Tax=Trichomycterus rosablanca TaxID=2290929 RepID=UPI002F35F81D
MDSEVEYLRDQVNRLNLALARYQEASPTSAQVEDLEGDSAAPWINNKNIMAPLILEYDRHLQQMESQLKRYQMQMVDLKASLEQVVQENERLYAEQRISIEKQLESLSVDADAGAVADTVAISNLEDQLKCAVEERLAQMWEAAAQEMDHLQKSYQNNMRDSQVHTVQHTHIQNQMAELQQLAQKLQAANQNLESMNEQLVKTVAEQNSELEELRNHLRKAKQDVRTATAKAEEMNRLMQNVEDQMQRKEEDAAKAYGREEASDHRLQHMQAVLNQLESRLKAATQEAESVRRKEALWEKQVGELQNRCASLEEEKYEAFQKLRDSLQLAEEATLHRDQAQLREKQKIEELERMKEVMKQWVDEAPARTRREVEVVRKQCNSQIHRLTEELSALQLECADKQLQLERAHRERKAVEEELEKVYRQGSYGDPDVRKMEALHQRCLNAERMKEELELTLSTTNSTMKRIKLELNEELSRCQEEVRRLQVALSNARAECNTISEERLSLQQENHKLLKETNTLRTECLSAQRLAKHQVSVMQQEVRAREQAVESRIQEMEEKNKLSTAELQRRLLAQQHATNRYRERNKHLLDTFNTQLSSLREELTKQKQRSQELEFQLKLKQTELLEGVS